MSEPPRRIERSQLVPLSVEDSFTFFAEAYNLEALTPPWLGFRILTPRPIPMHKGTSICDLERIFDYRRDAVERLLGGRHNRLAPAGSER